MTEYETKNLTEIINTLLKGGSTPSEVFECIHNCINEGGITKVISLRWWSEDVKVLRPDLDKEQCGAVLDRTEHYHDANVGVRRDTLEIWADDLYPVRDLPETVREHLEQWHNDFGDDIGKEFEAIDEAWRKFLETPLNIRGEDRSEAGMKEVDEEES